MSYAGVEREYPRPCPEGQHTHEMNGRCHKCGIETTYDGLSVKEAERRRLSKENEELKAKNNELEAEVHRLKRGSRR